MLHLHSYSSGFLFLTAFFVSLGVFVMAVGIHRFSISLIDISFSMTISLSTILRERAGRLLHTKNQTT
jgi:hypothetical protein